MAAAEQERAHWARELHDETLQNLAAVRLGLAAQLRDSSPEAVIEAVREAVVELEREIRTLRALVTDLRPAALDDLGAQAAIEDLAERARGRGLEVDLTIDLAYEQDRKPDRPTSEVETTLYRIVQEALNNAAKHGGARRAQVEVVEDDSIVRVRVRDDGRGFDPIAHTDGFGLLGMRERVELLQGTLEVTSSPGRGTTINAAFPATDRRGAERRASEPRRPEHRPSRDRAPDARAYIDEATVRAPHGLDELAIRAVGQHEPDRTRSERLGDERLVHLHRRDHDPVAGDAARNRLIRSALNPSGIRKSSTSTSGC